jgi:hypothetical protein
MADTRKRAEALRYIERERSLQEIRKQDGDFEHTCCDPEMTDEERLACLGEEFGEVSTEILKKAAGDTAAMGNLFLELMQVAAVAAAWMEYLLEQGVMTDGT